MRVLVTGGAGFIGSNFVRRSAGRAYPGLDGAEVVVLDAAHLLPAIWPTSPRCSTRRGCGSCEGDIRDAALVDALHGRASTRSCTSPPSPTSTARSPARPTSSRPTCSAPSVLLRRRARAGGRAVRARVHRRGLRLDRATARGRRPTRWSRTRRTRRRRRRRTCSPAPITAPTACRCASRAAPTTTGPTSSPRRSSRCSSRTCSTASTCRSTATGSTSATGCTSTTTAAASRSSLSRRPARRGLQHRRRHRADQPRTHPPAARRGRRGRVPDRTGGRPARPRPPLLRRLDQDRRPNSATRRRCPSSRARRRPCAGTPTTAPGGSRSRPGRSPR